MKSLFLIITALFFLATSCSKAKPEGILSDKKMSELMTEVHILDSYLNTLPIDSGRKVMPVLYQRLFDKFKIDSTRFLKNVDYYYGNPMELEKLNTTIKDALSRYEREAFRADSIEQVHVRDSVNRVARLQRWAEEMKNLILNVHLDSTDYTFEVNNLVFFQDVPVQVYRHELKKPTTSVPAPEAPAGGGGNEPEPVVHSNDGHRPRTIDRPPGVKEVRRSPSLDKLKQNIKQ